MINRQRVQRIRRVIYSVIVILIFVPLILLIALCISMIGFIGDASRSLERIETYIVGEAAPAGQSDPQSATADPPVVGQASGSGPADVSQAASKEDPTDASQAADDEPDAPTAALDTPDSPESATLSPNSYVPVSYPAVYFDTVPAPSTLDPQALYLTFDNTPSQYFDDILAVLQKHDVPATFFVWWGDAGGAPSTGADYRALLNAGHSIGIHSADPSLPLSRLYADVDSYLADFSDIFTKIEEETGHRTRLYRLPGGSANPYSPARQQVLSDIREEMTRRGFLQFDWTASAQDAVNPPLSMQQILSNLHTTIEKGSRVIALMHDGTGSDSTVQALDVFIEQCLADGYTFHAIDADTVPFSFID
ncbi:polysaccharide deacetylase family protein [Ruminococcaceae bacterium OttesenSCG-928-L11]|nr:polysaccharide deacetylase family protein [Ruminococcaceae bacterium OttesenSCG-928-L11]